MISRALRAIEGWVDRHFIGFTVTGLFLLFIGLYFARSIFITIPAGHGGALWLRFFGGTVLHFTYGEGTKVIFPWDRIYIYDLRVRQETTEVDILTKEGLRITADITARFRLNPTSMGYITALAGPNYVETLLLPTIGAVTRTIAAQYNVDEIYSARRKEVEKRIMDVAAAALHDLIIETDDPDVVLQDLWFRSIRLPPTLQNAIESKLTQAQIAEQYVYILQREEREKERKIIEAEGIKSFQDIISSGISENYLRWKGIDATLRLAESTNSKIVIIGGKEGLPIILGPMENSAPSSGLPVPITTPPAQPNTGPPRPVQPRPGETATDPAKLLQDMQRLLPPIALDPRYALPVPPIDVIVPKRRDNSGG